MMDQERCDIFIGALSKFLQSLCNSYADFDKWVQIAGHLHLTMDTGQTVQYMVDEKLIKNYGHLAKHSNSLHSLRNKKQVQSLNNITSTKGHDEFEDFEAFKSALKRDKRDSTVQHNCNSVSEKKDNQIRDLLYGINTSFQDVLLIEKNSVDTLQGAKPQFSDYNSPQGVETTLGSSLHLLHAGTLDKKELQTILPPSTKPPHHDLSFKDNYKNMAMSPATAFSEDIENSDTGLIGPETNTKSLVEDQLSVILSSKLGVAEATLASHNPEENCWSSSLNISQNSPLDVKKLIKAEINHLCIDNNSKSKPPQTNVNKQSNKNLEIQSRVNRKLIIQHDGAGKDLIRSKTPFQCSICSALFTANASLKRHSRIHQGERPYVCSICGSTFTQASGLTNHMRKHSQEKPFCCVDCGKAFSQKGNLRAHILIHLDDRLFVCEACGRNFMSHFKLKVHRRSHTGERPFSCEECGASFARREFLLDHKRGCHTKEKPYVCGVCDRGFARNGDLCVHKRIHSGVKRYECDKCDTKFSRVDTLYVHQRTHTGAKPFACKTCGKTFTAYGGLQSHKRSHSGEKPFTCSECGQTFSQQGNLARHTARRHGKKAWACDVCPARFACNYELKNHKSKHCARTKTIN